MSYGQSKPRTATWLCSTLPHTAFTTPAHLLSYAQSVCWESVRDKHDSRCFYLMWRLFNCLHSLKHSHKWLYNTGGIKVWTCCSNWHNFGIPMVCFKCTFHIACMTLPFRNKTKKKVSVTNKIFDIKRRILGVAAHAHKYLLVRT